MFGVAGMVRHGTRRIYTHVTGYVHSLSSTQNSKPMKTSSSDSSTTHRPRMWDMSKYTNMASARPNF